MTVTNVHKDPATLTMTIESEYDAPVERVWQLWQDPRQLERWWGPPGYPATFVDHDLAPGGRVTYFMTAPEGDEYHGWWQVLAVDAPRSLEFVDGFGDDRGEPAPGMPTTNIRVVLEAQPSGATRMVIVTTFPSTEAMEQLVAMGMDEGMAAALGQIDALLRADVTSA